VDWIEKLFGVSPDGGDGSTEIGLALSLALMIAGLAVVFLRQGRGGRRSGSRSR
jgi:hypothetical protein